MERFVEGRREEGRALHPRYYAQHPQAADKKLRKATWQHYLHPSTRITFRVVDATHMNFRLPKGRDLFPVNDVFFQGAPLVLEPTARLQSALPDAAPIRIVVESVSPVIGRGKTGQLTIQPLSEAHATRVADAKRAGAL